MRSGRVKDYAELARVGMVSRARVTQIMNLNLRGRSIQEELLFLPRTEKGRDAVTLKDALPISMVPNWSNQRTRWQILKSSQDC